MIQDKITEYYKIQLRTYEKYQSTEVDKDYIFNTNYVCV